MTPSDTAHPEGERDAILNEASELLIIARKALWKLGLHGQGDNLQLSHEVRMFALAFSSEAPADTGVFQKGSGREVAWQNRAYALISTPPSRPQGEGGRDIVTVIENLGAQEWRVQIGDVLLFYGEDRADAIERATAVEQAILAALSNQGKPSS